MGKEANSTQAAPDPRTAPMGLLTMLLFQTINLYGHSGRQLVCYNAKHKLGHLHHPTPCPLGGHLAQRSENSEPRTTQQHLQSEQPQTGNSPHAPQQAKQTVTQERRHLLPSQKRERPRDTEDNSDGSRGHDAVWGKRQFPRAQAR